MKIKTKKSKDLAFAILIGGGSTRFGSDKGLFQLQEKPLISYLLETLTKLGYDIFLVANSKKQVQNYIDNIDIKKIVAFILDEYELISNTNLRIPLLGLYSAFKELKKIGYKRVFTLSCDTPLVPFKVFEFIINQSEGYDCCIPKWMNNFTEPLLSIYNVEKAFQKAKANLLKKNYRLTNLIDEKWSINYISIEDSIKPLDRELVSFININKPEDLEKLRIYVSKSMIRKKNKKI